jgi:acetyl esterase
MEKASLSDKINPLVSPMKGALAGLPPPLILTAECDPLRDEGELYGHKLVESGVKTDMIFMKKSEKKCKVF